MRSTCEGADWLHVSQRQQPYLQRRANRLAPVGGAQLPKDVVKVCLDGGRSKAEVASHPFGGVPLGDASQYLHFPRS